MSFWESSCFFIMRSASMPPVPPPIMPAIPPPGGAQPMAQMTRTRNATGKMVRVISFIKASLT
jgi:hypothetical protein